MSHFMKYVKYNFITNILGSSRKFTSNHTKSAEERIKNILNKNFPLAQSIDVMDVSGGCGAMYEIAIKAPQFQGLSIVKQHKLVTEALKEEIKDMHGIRIQTSPT